MPAEAETDLPASSMGMTGFFFRVALRYPRLLVHMRNAPSVSMVLRIVAYILQLIRSMRKVVVHAWTGTCEIERILSRTSSSGGTSAAAMLLPADLATWTHLVEHSLRQSKVLRDVYEQHICPGGAFSVEEVASTIAQRKHIVPGSHTQNRLILVLRVMLWTNSHCLPTLVSLTQLQFDDKKPTHLVVLDRLWRAMRPEVSRTDSKQWQDLGFQGRRPWTDLRRTGMLSLVCLEFYAHRHAADARRQWSESCAGRKWYPFALAGIHLADELFFECIKDRRHSSLCGRIFFSAAARNVWLRFVEPSSSPDPGSPSSSGGIHHHSMQDKPPPKRKDSAVQTDAVDADVAAQAALSLDEPALEPFFEAFSRTMVLFHNWWMKEPAATVMEFDHLKAKFFSSSANRHLTIR